MTASPVALEPLAAPQRLPMPDVLRGFALLGILLMNIEYFTRPMQGLMLGLDPRWSGIDRLANLFIATFVQGKFWTLFSLLFGMGFATLLARAEVQRVAFGALYTRRLIVLLLIGLAHAFVLFAGDILVVYAIAGFGLLLIFRAVPTPQVWRLGLVLYVLPLALMWSSTGMIVMASFASPEFAEAMTQASRDLRAEYAAAEAIYRDGSFWQVVRQRVADSFAQYAGLVSLLPMVLGMFLIGGWAERVGILRDVDAHLPLFRRALLTGGPFGAVLALAAMPHLIDADHSLLTVSLAFGVTLMTLANLLLCVAYAAAMVLLARRSQALRDWLAPAGRMALSNYLLQSLVFTTLFFGYGFGLWGSVPRAMQVVLACAFFALQLLASRWWLARFRYGPMEWLWRALTYRKMPPMRV